jgi:hypothetical protein
VVIFNFYGSLKFSELRILGNGTILKFDNAVTQSHPKINRIAHLYRFFHRLISLEPDRYPVDFAIATISLLRANLVIRS